MPWKETNVIEGRMKFIATIKNGKWAFANVCRDFGISRKTGYKYLRNYKAEGIDGLKEKLRVRKTQSKATNENTVRLSNGAVSPGSPASGHEADGQSLHVCRANYKNGLHPGKLLPKFQSCNIEWGDREITISNYEVIVTKKGYWVLSIYGNIPEGIPAAGNKANGEQLFICRGYIHGGLHLGKILPAFKGCQIAYAGKNYLVNFDYEVASENYVNATHETGSFESFLVQMCGSGARHVGTRCFKNDVISCRVNGWPTDPDTRVTMSSTCNNKCVTYTVKNQKNGFCRDNPISGILAIQVTIKASRN